MTHGSTYGSREYRARRPNSAYSSSTIVALAMPPPSHMVCRP